MFRRRSIVTLFSILLAGVAISCGNAATKKAEVITPAATTSPAPSASPRPTASTTPSPRPSASATPTATPSATPAPSVAPTASPTTTPSLTAAPEPTPSATPSTAPTPTPAPTPILAPTPQPVAGPTFVVNTLPVGCHAQPDAASSPVAQRGPGSVQAMDVSIRVTGGTWQREVSQQCWVRVDPGPVHTYSGLPEAQAEGAILASRSLALDQEKSAGNLKIRVQNAWARPAAGQPNQTQLIFGVTITAAADYEYDLKQSFTLHPGGQSFANDSTPAPWLAIGKVGRNESRSGYVAFNVDPTAYVTQLHFKAINGSSSTTDIPIDLHIMDGAPVKGKAEPTPRPTATPTAVPTAAPLTTPRQTPIPEPGGGGNGGNGGNGGGGTGCGSRGGPGGTRLPNGKCPSR